MDLKAGSRTDPTQGPAHMSFLQNRVFTGAEVERLPSSLGVSEVCGLFCSVSSF